jgi:hypothetical protein
VGGMTGELIMSSELRNEKVSYTDDGIVRTWDEVTTRPKSEKTEVAIDCGYIHVTDCYGNRIAFDVDDAEHIGNLLIKKAGEAKKSTAPKAA